jgi:hypothetical protein
MDNIETAAPVTPATSTSWESVVSQDILDNADLVDAIFAFIEDEFPQIASRTA